MSTKSAKPRKDGAGVGADNKDEHNGSELNRSGIDNVEVDGGEVRDNEIEKKCQKTSKSKNLSKSKKTVRSDFLTAGARLAFTKLRQAFVKAPILHHFDPECHIRVETDALSYTIGEVFSQLILDDLGQ